MNRRLKSTSRCNQDKKTPKLHFNDWRVSCCWKIFVCCEVCGFVLCLDTNLTRRIFQYLGITWTSLERLQKNEKKIIEIEKYQYTIIYLTENKKIIDHLSFSIPSFRGLVEVVVLVLDSDIEFCLASLFTGSAVFISEKFITKEWTRDERNKIENRVSLSLLSSTFSFL
jgi:hypothetical protein